MASDEGFSSFTSSKETLDSPSSPDEAVSNDVEKQTSLSPATGETMSVAAQNAEAKSDDKEEATFFKLFGCLIKVNKPKTCETSSMTSSGSGKDVESSETAIIDQYQNNSKKRKTRVLAKQNTEKRLQQQRRNSLPVLAERRPGEEPGIIRKKLTRSDVDQSSRLLIGKQDMAKHVLPYLSEDQIATACSIQGLPVPVWDVDSGDFHHLVLKQWKTGSFVLTGKWRPQFVQRKNLKVGDTILLSWHRLSSVFHFQVSARSNDNTEASSSRADHSGGEDK